MFYIECVLYREIQGILHVEKSKHAAQARQQANRTIAGVDSLTAEREGGKEGGRARDRERKREKEESSWVAAQSGALRPLQRTCAMPTRCKGAGGEAGRIRCFRESCTRYAASWGEFAGSPS